MTIYLDEDAVFSEMDALQDEESYYWLRSNAPRHARIVEKLIERGVSPEQVRRRFLSRSRGEQSAFAARIEQAARHYQATRQREAQ